jgi:hypothetical protein
MPESDNLNVVPMQLPVVPGELAKNGYTRYGAVTGFKNFQGAPMPEFEQLNYTIQSAWVAGTNLPVEDVNKLLQLQDSYYRQEVSDGYHTFGELYDHRIVLFHALAKRLAADPATPENLRPWRSETHFDGSSFFGYFHAGIGHEPGTQISYHIGLDWWATFDFCQTLNNSPEWDGHTPKDVITRLLAL